MKSYTDPIYSFIKGVWVKMSALHNITFRDIINRVSRSRGKEVRYGLRHHRNSEHHGHHSN